MKIIFILNLCVFTLQLILGSLFIFTANSRCLLPKEGRKSIAYAEEIQNTKNPDHIIKSHPLLLETTKLFVDLYADFLLGSVKVMKMLLALTLVSFLLSAFKLRVFQIKQKTLL
jgi:hypothetical protein